MFGLVSSSLNYSNYSPESQQESSQTPLIPNAGGKWLKDLNLNLDEISLVSTERRNTSGGSLLYYALSSEYRFISGKFAAANLLIKYANGNPKRVHFCGRSMTLVEFLKKHEELMKFEYVPYDSEPLCQSNEEIRRLGDEYVRSKLDSKYVADIIAGLKFSEWDESANKIAEHSQKEGDTEVLVRLFNAFIVTDEDRPMIHKLPKCEVITFNGANPSLQDVLVCSMRGDFFVPTAMRHILSCCNRGERYHFRTSLKRDDYVRMPDGDKPMRFDRSAEQSRMKNFVGSSIL